MDGDEPLSPPFAFSPSTDNPWESWLREKLLETNSIIYMDSWSRTYHIRGDGVRLGIPFDFIVMTPEFDLVDIVLRGIDVSIAHKDQLNYLQEYHEPHTDR